MDKPEAKKKEMKEKVVFVKESMKLGYSQVQAIKKLNIKQYILAVLYQSEL